MKIFIAAIILIPALLFGGALLLLDNPGLYQDELASVVKSQTGYELKINGDVKWRYWPPIAIDVSGVELRSSETKNALMTLDSVAVDLKLLPLIFGAELAIDGLSIDGLVVNAVVDAAGKGNWEVAGETVGETAETGEDSDSVKLDIASIKISNANINYEELATASHYVITLNSLSTGAVRYDELTRVDIDMVVEDKSAKLRSVVTASGNLAFDQNFSQYQFKQLTLNTQTSMPDMGDISATVTLNGSADLDAGTLTLADSAFNVADVQGSTSLNVTDLMGAPTLQGKLQVTPFAIKPLMARLKLDPIVTSNPDALKTFGLTANISGSLPKLDLTNLTAQLDSSAITGSLHADMGDKIKAGFDLAIDQINVSDYLEPDTAPPASGTAAPAPTDSEAIPVELLNTYEIDGKLTIGQVIYDTYTLNDLVASIVNRQQKLAVITTMSGYDSQINMNLDVQTPVSGTPQGTTALSIKGLNITKLTGFEWITGTLALDSQTSFKGSMLSQVLDTLTGDNRFTITDGTLDVTPVKTATAVVDGLRGKTSSVAAWPDKMPFESLKGNLALKDGIKANQQLNVQVETMLIAGTGGVDYWNNQLAFDIGITLQDSATSQFSVKPPLAGLRWPLHCEGAMDASPVDLCLPDMKGVQNLVADLLKQEVKRQGSEKIAEKLKDQLPPEIQEKAKNLLKGLFGT